MNIFGRINKKKAMSRSWIITTSYGTITVRKMQQIKDGAQVNDH